MSINFETPVVISNIRDIAEIYTMNDTTGATLDAQLENMENDIFIETMSLSQIKRFEDIIGITSQDTDSLEDRIYRVKIRNNEQLPYSYRALIKKLNNICGADGYTLTLDSDSLKVKLALTQKANFNDTKQLLEDIVPLNMTLDVDYLYNQYTKFEAIYTYEQLESFTYSSLREDVI